MIKAGRNQMESAHTELWRYRGFIFSSVKREFKSRYMNSLFGALWAFVGPLAMILMYTLIFSQLMRTKIAGIDSVYGYSTFLCAGMLTWGFFSETLTRSINVFVENANLIKKINFPKACLPLIVFLNSAISFGIIFTLFLIAQAFIGSFPGVKLVAILPLLTIQTMMALGLGIAFGVINVFFRDVGHIFNIGMQFLFWGTPIVYPLNVLPEFFQSLVRLNPLTALIMGYQDVIVKDIWPDWLSLWWPATCGLGFSLLALVLYRRLSTEIVDEL